MHWCNLNALFCTIYIIDYTRARNTIGMVRVAEPWPHAGSASGTHICYNTLERTSSIAASASVRPRIMAAHTVRSFA